MPPLLEATKRHDRRGQPIRVDPQASRANFSQEPHRACEVAGEDAARKRVARMVGHRDGFSFVFEAQHAQHRAEELVLNDWKRLVLTAHNSRSEIITTWETFWPAATGQNT